MKTNLFKAKSMFSNCPSFLKTVAGGDPSWCMNNRSLDSALDTVSPDSDN